MERTAEAMKHLENKICFGGLDLASNDDFCAFVLMFPPQAGVPMFSFLEWLWIPEDTIDPTIERARGQKRSRPRETVEQLARWRREGWLIATEGNYADNAHMLKDIAEANKKYNIKEIYFDPHNARELATKLMEMGITIREFRQNSGNFNEACLWLTKAVATGTLAHMHNPVMAWMAQHAILNTRTDGLSMPDRKRSTEKIDGIVALLMAIKAALANPVRVRTPQMVEVDL